jgi:hypothetical protein
MGSWRTVHITGTCHPDEVDILYAHLHLPRDPNKWNLRIFEKVGSLTPIPRGVFSLPNWAAENIDALGNLFESGSSIEAIAEHVERLVDVAPSLNIQVDCGGEFESLTCTASVVVFQDRMVGILRPKVEKIPAIVNYRERLLNAMNP